MQYSELRRRVRFPYPAYPETPVFMRCSGFFFAPWIKIWTLYEHALILKSYKNDFKIIHEIIHEIMLSNKFPSIILRQKSECKIRF